MTPTQTRESHEAVRTAILEAALERFTSYGFGKTTMAEIAADCGMSASNLYRYFENKQDLGAALSATCLGGQESELEKLVTQTGRPASTRLADFIVATLDHTHHHWSVAPHLSELVDAICEKRRDVVTGHIAAKTRLLNELLVQGNESGEFDVDDTKAAAEAILIANTVFDVPHFMSFHSRDEFERIARNLAALLVRGLARRD